MIAQRGPQFLAVFSVITALTLLIVCANVANLMLARAVVRQREMAVRQSFGASQLRVIRLVLAEGIAISGAAWAVACFCAWIMSKAMARWIPRARGAPPSSSTSPPTGRSSPTRWSLPPLARSHSRSDLRSAHGARMCCPFSKLANRESWLAAHALPAPLSSFSSPWRSCYSLAPDSSIDRFHSPMPSTSDSTATMCCS